MSSFTDPNDQERFDWKQALDWEPCRLMLMAFYLDRELISSANRDIPVDIINHMGYEHFKPEYWGRV